MIWFQERLLKKIDKIKIDQILSNYGNFKVLSFTPQAGWQNLSLKVEANAGPFILKIYRTRNLRKLKNTSSLIDFLAKSGFPAQKFISDKKANRVISVKISHRHYFAVLFEFLKGATKKSLTSGEIIQLGNLTAALHKTLANYGRKDDFGRLDVIRMANFVNAKFESSFTKNDKERILWTKFWFLQGRQLKDYKKTLAVEQLIHGDLAPSNIVFGDSKLLGLLDFDDVSAAPRIYDLVNFVGNYSQTVKSWGWQDEILPVLKNLLTGYGQVLSLTGKEKELVPQLLRFWFFRKIIWAKRESAKKYRQKWANDVILWCMSALAEKF